MDKLAWRRAWFQVHKWIGLALAILIIPLCLTGSALVWKDATDRIVNPARYATSGAAVLPVDRYVGAARAVLASDERISGIEFPENDGPVIVSALQPQPQGARGRPVRTMVYLDPPTARVLDVAASNTGVLRVMHILHGSLMVPGVGRTIVGWIGVAMMVSAFTGLWLWWPTVGRWTRGLRWRRHRNLDTNLHHLAGFWIALPLFVLSLTGAWISFPDFFGALSGAPERGEHGPPRRGGGEPLVATRQSAAEVAGIARAQASGNVREIDWPSGDDARWSVTIDGAGSARQVAIADANGAVTKVSTPRAHGGSGIAGLMRRIHDGQGMGPVWQAIVFLGGLLPAMLGVTGVIMWSRARGWRAATEARRRRSRPA
jgi:uncharacterized iron-regulated membrane protein